MAALTLELPVRMGKGIHTFGLSVAAGEEAPDGRGGVQRPWTATLNFDLDGLGPVWAQVAVANTVAVSFRTERPEASEALAVRLDELRAALAGAGLTPGQLSAQLGLPPAPPSRRPPVPLLDERA
jgi:hypothetical protein